MDWQVIAVYVILLVTVVLFVTDRVRPDIVGLMIISVLRYSTARAGRQDGSFPGLYGTTLASYWFPLPD